MAYCVALVGIGRCERVLATDHAPSFSSQVTSAAEAVAASSPTPIPLSMAFVASVLVLYEQTAQRTRHPAGGCQRQQCRRRRRRRREQRRLGLHEQTAQSKGCRCAG